MMPLKRLEKEDYTVGWICALSIPELKASRLLFDGEEHVDVVLDRRTIHQYVYGEIHGHNVVMGCLPASQMGKASAAGVANEMFTTFTGLHFALIVGVGGAVPMPNDIRLGDVVVSLPDLSRQHGGVVQYDFGKAMHDGRFVKTGQLNQPSNTVLSGLGKLRSAPERSSHFGQYLQSYQEDSYWDRGESDHLFSADYHHAEGQPTCSKCDLENKEIRSDRPTSAPRVHYGLIASGDQVMKDATKRDALSQQYGGILCFEMEAAGIMNIFPCLNVRGICDYCDSHKNKSWQPFAAAAAAAWAKELLRNIAPTRSAGRTLPQQHEQAIEAQDLWLERFVGQLTATKRSVDDVRSLIGRISSYEPRKILKRIAHKRLPGTTEWLTNDPAFAEWESDGTSSRTLWLSGKVGSGKTVAMTTAVHHLLATAQPYLKAMVIHHFFQYPDTKATDLFRSLSRQLLQLHMDYKNPCSSELANDLDMHFGACNRSPNLHEVVEDVMLPLTFAFHRLVVCIDGIDVCESREQDHVWAGLSRLSVERAKQGKHTKTLITGENESKLATLLPANALRIRLDHGLISDDIKRYIDARLEKEAHPRQLFHNTGLRSRVKEALMRRAENMFLWVHLQLEEIIHICTTVAEVEATLQDLPKTLHALYMRCLKRKSNGRLLCNPKVIKWCSAARKPLCIDSLSEMLALDWQSGEVERSTMPSPGSVIQSGVSLMTLEEQGMLFEPAHHTVRQFIFSDLLRDSLAHDTDFPSATRDQLAMSLRDTEQEIGQLCLCHVEAKTRLEIEKRRTVQAPPVLGMIPPFLKRGLRLGQRDTAALTLPLPRLKKQETASFLQYAIKGWITHTRNFGKETPSWDTFKLLALQPNASWKLHPWPAVGNTQNSHLRGLLGYAVAYNHQPLLQLLVEQPTMLPKKVYDEVLPGNDLLPALHVAAKSGHAELIPKLLKLCSANTVDPLNGQTALHVALAHGQDEFAAALCGLSGLKVDTVDAFGASPLALAFRNGLKSTLKFGSGGLTYEERQSCHEIRDILLRDLDVNSRDRYGKTPLHNAVAKAHKGYIKLLVSCGADVNARGDRQTPLHTAVRTGDLAIVKLLLASQADANAKGHRGQTPLHTAVLLCNTAMVKLLLTSQADVNAHDEMGYTPLHRAISPGNEPMAKLLLAYHADANAKDESGCTSLHHAVGVQDYQSFVRLLLAGHADANAENKDGWTPLHRAARFGFESIVQRLVAAAADVNARNKDGWTPLHIAANAGHEAVVRVLLDTGKTEVDSRDRGQRTPLHYAIQQGHQIIVESLLSLGQASCNVRDSQGFTPLHSAVEKTQMAIVKILLDNSATDINRKDNSGRTPLHCAARNGSVTIVGLLLASGKADVLSRDSIGRTPLLEASLRDYDEIVKLLDQSERRTPFVGEKARSVD